jgi:hypothetical protein
MPGEWVRVRSKAEVFATLDERGTLEGLPFMPEMIKYCGRRLRVTQRADATCAGDGAVRRMPDTVHLQNVRCDGSFHDGCQAACLMYWKEAWLERADAADTTAPPESDDDERAFVETTLIPATKAADQGDDEGERYSCQATEIPQATERVAFLRDREHYRQSLRNWKLPKILRGFAIELFNRWQAISKTRVPARLRIAGGEPYPFVRGQLNKGETPRGGDLNLRPGDLVRIKSKADIVATLDKDNRNRGLFFDAEMANYCGRTARVQGRVNRLIEESNGKMIEIKSDCIILEGVVCVADYHQFCTRAIYSYWREIWLEKIDEAEGPPTAPCVNRWSRV